jgi:putative membrane protein
MDADLGLLILRLYLGVNFLAYGLQKVFGAFGGPGLSGYAGYIESMRFRPAKPMGYIGAFNEFICGLLMLLGLFVPLAAAGIIGQMVVAMGAVHLKNGYFNSQGGVTYNLSLIAAALCLAFAGPGALALDPAVGTDLSGTTGGVVALALLSPIHAFGETLFSAHMVQHLLLILVAAPLLALGSPALPLWRALPAGARSASGALRRRSPVNALARVLGAPVFVGALHAVVLWIWHLPRVYDAAVANEALHVVEHMSFTGSAFLLWAVVLRGPTRRAPSRAVALALLFVTALHSSALGALLTFASQPLFAAHRHGAIAWGLGPLTDQQLAGLIMWVPAGAFYVVAMSAVFLSWLKEDHERPARSVAAEASE